MISISIHCQFWNELQDGLDVNFSRCLSYTHVSELSCIFYKTLSGTTAPCWNLSCTAAAQSVQVVLSCPRPPLQVREGSRPTSREGYCLLFYTHGFDGGDRLMEYLRFWPRSSLRTCNVFTVLSSERSLIYEKDELKKWKQRHTAPSPLQQPLKMPAFICY